MTTRSALLGAGARVFVRRGLYGATIREIVEEAGFTAPALYYHFRDKEDLYAQLVHEGAAEFRATAEEGLRAAASARARLRAMAAAGIHFGQADRSRLRVLYAEFFGPGGSEELKLGLEEVRDWSLARVTEILAAGVAAGELPRMDVERGTRMFTGLLSGLLIEQAHLPDSSLLDERLPDDIVALFLAGIGALEEK